MIYTPTKHTKNPKASHASRPCVFPNQLAERIHHHNSHTCSSTGRPKSRSLPCFLPMCFFKPTSQRTHHPTLTRQTPWFPPTCFFIHTLLLQTLPQTSHFKTRSIPCFLSSCFLTPTSQRTHYHTLGNQPPHLTLRQTLAPRQ